MLSLAIAAAIASEAPVFQPHRGLTEQATASVRIVSGTRVRFSGGDGQAAYTHEHPRPQVRDLVLDGRPVPLSIVEFE